MPFGFKNNKVDTIKKKNFIENTSNSDEKKDKSIKSDDGNKFKVKSYITDKNPKKYNDKNDMSFYHKPWHQLTPSQQSARSDMDSIMDY